MIHPSSSSSGDMLRSVGRESPVPVKVGMAAPPEDPEEAEGRVIIKKIEVQILLGLFTNTQYV